MGRRDTAVGGGGGGGGGQRHRAPVDNYRKQLGRHDTHEQRRSNRARVRSQGDKIERAAAFRSTGVWLLVTIPLVLGALYIVMYAVITGDVQPWQTLLHKVRNYTM